MIYFTADTHFQHQSLVRNTRHFTITEHHDELILDGINKTVGRDDRLYHLGDFAWRAEESYAERIICKNVHFIVGNHDKAKVGKLFRSCEQTTLLKERVPERWSPEQRRIKIFLSHYAHAYWPSSHYGSLHLYGHTHRMREETLDKLFPRRRAMDVGVDNAYRLLGEYRPFSLDEVLDFLMPRPGHDPVEWYRENFGDI